MRTPDATLTQLRAFLAVVRTGRFVRAAEEMHISPPALTQQIGRLERTIGASLLDRDSHPIQPTDAGRRLLPAATDALRLIDDALADLSGALSVAVRIGVLNTPTSPRASAMLEALRQGDDPVPYTIQQLPWNAQTSAVQSGMVDASFIRPPVNAERDLRYDLIEEEERVVVVSAHHRLSSRRVIDLAELDDETVVHGGDDMHEWSRWWAVDPRPSGVPVRYGTAVQTMEEAWETVRRSEQVLITAHSVPRLFRTTGLKVLRIRDAARCALVLCTRESDRSASIGTLRSMAIGWDPPISG